MILKKLNLLMLDIQKFKYSSPIQLDIKYFLFYQIIKNKSRYSEKINNFNYYLIKKNTYSNQIFLKKNTIFRFCSNNKQKEQNSVQEDLETIKKFDLNDVKGFQDLIRQIGIKYKNQPLKSIWIFKNNIHYLKEKNCEKNHSFSYYILLALFLKLQNREQIQKMLPQVTQIIKFNDENGINLRQIKSLLFAYYYSNKTSQDHQIAFQYLEDAFSENIINNVQVEEIFLIERKLKKSKLQEAQKLINSAVEILKKSQSFNVLASRIFKFKQELHQLYQQNKSPSTQQQTQQHYQKCFLNYTQVATYIVEYMAKWRTQLDQLQNKIVNQLTPKTKQSQLIHKNLPAFVLRWQYVTVLWNAYYSLMRLASLYKNHEEIIILFKANEQLFRSLKMFNTSSIVNVYLFASKSFLFLNRKEEALSALTQADQILFSITKQKLIPQIFIQLFCQYLQIISNQDRQDIHKIQPEKFKVKLITLSKSEKTFLQQVQLRKLICDEYLSRQFYEKVLEQLKQLNDRFQQFRGKLSKQSELNILVTILVFKSNVFLRQRQFHKCIDYANKAENLIKIYKSSEQFQSPQSQLQERKKPNHHSLFIFYQIINTNKSYAHINLAFQVQNLDQIRQNQIKCLQYLQRVFAYQSNQIKNINQIDLMNQFRRLEQSISLLELEWKTAQASQKRFQIYKNIIGEFQYLIVKANQNQVPQDIIIYHSLQLQNIKISYQILLSQINGQENDQKQAITRSINKLRQLISITQDMIQKSKDQQYNIQTWKNVKNLFRQRIKVLESQLKA